MKMSLYLEPLWGKFMAIESWLTLSSSVKRGNLMKNHWVDSKKEQIAHWPWTSLHILYIRRSLLCVWNATKKVNFTIEETWFHFMVYYTLCCFMYFRLVFNNVYKIYDSINFIWAKKSMKVSTCAFEASLIGLQEQN